MVTVQQVVAAIRDEPLRVYTEAAMATVDARFWTDPASSTGKYHPAYDQGDGGLARHTAMCAVYTILGIRRYGMPHLRDVLLCGAVLHDSCKNGVPWTRHTKPDHGALASVRMAGPWLEGHESVRAQVEVAAYAVQYHYGIWTDPVGRDPFEFHPTTEGQRDLAVAALVLQEADYYSTRRFLGEPDPDRLAEELRL